MVRGKGREKEKIEQRRSALCARPFSLWGRGMPPHLGCAGHPWRKGCGHSRPAASCDRRNSRDPQHANQSMMRTKSIPTIRVMSESAFCVHALDRSASPIQYRRVYISIRGKLLVDQQQRERELVMMLLSRSRWGLYLLCSFGSCCRQFRRQRIANGCILQTAMQGSCASIVQQKPVTVVQSACLIQLDPC